MKITLKKKKLSTGKESYYIEYYKGYQKDKNGKMNHIREFEYLGKEIGYLYVNPSNQVEKRKNKEIQELAENILAIRKADLVQGRFGIVNKEKVNITLYKYFDTLKEDRSSYLSNYGAWCSAKRYIDLYFHPSTVLSELTIESIEGFKRFLDREATTKYGTPLKHGSKYSYFNRFRATIRKAYGDGYLTNPKFLEIKPFKDMESQREYLTLEEVQALASTECKFPILKKAFLFSCLTGLRWGDIHKLKWSQIRDEGDSYRIFFTQQKTKDLEYMFISRQARDLIGKKRMGEERVFIGLQYGTAITTELLRWCMKAGINKHITFHCARHTAATLLLDAGADLYSVMKILGHKDIRTTQIYAKIMDKKLRETAELLPELEFDFSY